MILPEFTMLDGVRVNMPGTPLHNANGYVIGMWYVDSSDMQEIEYGVYLDGLDSPLQSHGFVFNQKELVEFEHIGLPEVTTVNKGLPSQTKLPFKEESDPIG